MTQSPAEMPGIFYALRDRETRLDYYIIFIVIQ